MMNKALFNLTMKNVIVVGNKKFAFIPVELLFADFRFQRRGKKAQQKINAMAAAWDYRKMDPLRVVPHYEECRFSVIDGWHRYSAAVINGVDYLVCEIIELPESEEKRLIEEASLFAEQGEHDDPLSPMEKHRANIIRGVEKNINLQKLIDKYKIEISEGQSRSAKKVNYLTGFNYALEMAGTNMEVADKVFMIICQSGWNLSPNGLGNYALRPLFNLLRLHREHADQIVLFLSEHLRGIDPNLWFAFAAERYPERKQIERITLYYEDVVTENLDIPRLYFGGTIKVAA